MFFESVLLNIVIILVLIVALLYDYITKFFSYWYVRHVPYKKGIPCLGSDFERIFGLRNTTQVVRKLYFEHPQEKLVGYIKGRIPDMIVRDLDVIKLILTTDFVHFYNKGLCLDKSSDICIKNNLFYVEGEKWTLLREHIQMYLKISEENLLINDKIGENSFGKYNGDTNINEFLATVMDKFLCYYINAKDSSDTFVTTLRQSLQKTTFPNNLRSYVKTIFPYIYTLLGFHTNSVSILKNKATETFLKFHLDKFNALHSKIMEINKLTASGKDNNNPDDLLSHLCSIITEGYIPCYNVTISVLYELAKNPQIQERIRHYIMTSTNESSANPSDYLDKVIKEAMRLYPPYSIINRKCMKTYKVPEMNILIDKGVTVTIPVEAIHRDSYYYHEPEKFDPDRFSNENVEKRHPYAFIPFGTGPRKCVGEQVAYSFIRQIVGVILTHYSLEQCSKTPAVLLYKDYEFKRILAQDVWLKLTSLRE